MGKSKQPKLKKKTFDALLTEWAKQHKGNADVVAAMVADKGTGLVASRKQLETLLQVAFEAGAREKPSGFEATYRVSLQSWGEDPKVVMTDHNGYLAIFCATDPIDHDADFEDDEQDEPRHLVEVIFEGDSSPTRIELGSWNCAKLLSRGT